MNMENLPEANVPGTGWRISSSSGRKWFRIEKGSPEFLEWMKFYRAAGKQNLANFIMKSGGFTFVAGPSVKEFGGAQIAFLNQSQEGQKF